MVFYFKKQVKKNNLKKMKIIVDLYKEVWYSNTCRWWKAAYKCVKQKSKKNVKKILTLLNMFDILLTQLRNCS